MKKLLMLPAIFFALPVMAQQIITGSVLDETTRLPAKGVTVAIQNTKTVTTTDQNGKFSLSTDGKKNQPGYSRKRL
ncbi:MULTISPECIES: carboxypeptidase-like regulatory domain-containing protein [unclassified Chryseobacterium]|uniref:carboxypeptidase-like regulatory domain-containing protein n=1 Tax=unclassified Chryseobacterium TaxID=2593645 RepID=UPI000D38C83E|nr:MULTISPECIES: carboxypeptidase-like regulatory domain-containing protein [unclassified Chryseobacterium]PTT67537.1 hypothetical protein DBR25_21090 [Chryseobacterium sp. HMWF001]PVV51510.1 hypothetical protein DD829_20335 [Chryseobacterium sp. HMWF035]